MATQYALIASIHANLQRLTPPSDMSEAHAALVELQDTVGVQCYDAIDKAEEILGKVPDIRWLPTSTPVPSPTLKPTRTPTPTKTPTLGEPARSPQKPVGD